MVVEADVLAVTEGGADDVVEGAVEGADVDEVVEGGAGTGAFAADVLGVADVVVDCWESSSTAVK